MLVSQIKITCFFMKSNDLKITKYSADVFFLHYCSIEFLKKIPVRTMMHAICKVPRFLSHRVHHFHWEQDDSETWALQTPWWLRSHDWPKSHFKTSLFDLPSLILASYWLIMKSVIRAHMYFTQECYYSDQQNSATPGKNRRKNSSIRKKGFSTFFEFPFPGKESLSLAGYVV